jgi:hypothetical protein
MNEDIENRPDMNTGKKWSQMDLLDLANCIRLNDPVEEIASFMCRSRREIREKIAELERSGELPGLIEKAAAEAVDEPEDDNDTQGNQPHSCGTPTPPMMLGSQART